MAHQSDDGLYWGDDGARARLPRRGTPPKAPAPFGEGQGEGGAPGIAAPIRPIMPPRLNQTATIETTGYATLALIEHGDR